MVHQNLSLVLAAALHQIPPGTKKALAGSNWAKSEAALQQISHLLEEAILAQFVVSERPEMQARLQGDAQST
ncbi:hypothetical protein [Pararhizobium antarcticum]|uniref:Uncharacterized protein n=1 Tax=Pararhizobium antarcticum TaxID=1798805 RepID=A0A657LQ53_9HYPH|nr:hypothetical protein [Pararhizobium antarcticum]OJF93885.1 hypothetical protein AX760_21060 [Pararhizobium antarcticum]OJF99281.1 hypothetical protein AX761_11190 [Rhizobium sp. 58]